MVTIDIDQWFLLYTTSWKYKNNMQSISAMVTSKMVSLFTYHFVLYKLKTKWNRESMRFGISHEGERFLHADFAMGSCIFSALPNWKMLGCFIHHYITCISLWNYYFQKLCVVHFKIFWISDLLQIYYKKKSTKKISGTQIKPWNINNFFFNILKCNQMKIWQFLLFLA